jgi:exonuclease III
MKARAWGNSTSVTSGTIEKVDIGSEYVGSLNSVMVNADDGSNIGIANIYGLLEKTPDQPKSVVYLGIHRKLDKIERWINSEIESKPDFIVICGDFNNDRRMDDHETFKGRKQGSLSNELFDRIISLGMTDLLALAYPDFVQAHRHVRSKFPWQLDHFFVSDHAANLVSNIEVIDNPNVREISDHNPIVVDFDFPKQSL